MVFPQPPENYSIELSEGRIPGHSKIAKFGHNSNVSSTWVSVSPFAAAVNNFPASASTMTISSDDINDTSAGSGARKITVIGLDSNYDLISEDILTSGQTPVSTVNSYLRILRMVVRQNAGGGDINLGNVFIGTGTVTLGKPANVFGCIPLLSGIGAGQSLSGFTTIPKGKQAIIKHLQISASAGKTVETILRIRPFGEIFNAKNHIITFEVNYHHPYGLGLGEGVNLAVNEDIIDEKSDIELITLSSAGGTSVSAGFSYELFNK